MKPFIKIALPILLVVILLFLDLWTKNLIVNALPTQGESITVWEPYLKLIRVENTGVAFGMFSEETGPDEDIPLAKNLVFTILSLLATGLIIYLYFSLKPGLILPRICFLAILAGALGNMIDRLIGPFWMDGDVVWFYGRVIDFINMGFESYRWFTYNLADAYITIAVIALLVYFLINYNKNLFKENPKKASSR